MHIRVDRIKSDDEATLSLIYIDGVFECFGLEDEYREEKVPGETRIPAGYYHIGLRTIGGFDARYSKKFPIMHEGMLQVLDVPGFEYILIHIGNTDKNTAGCLLVGKGCMVGEEITIQNSTGAYRELYTKVLAAAKNGHVSIEYCDLDGSDL